MNAEKQGSNTTKRAVEIVIEHDSDLISPICWNSGKPKSRRALYDAANCKVKSIVSVQMTQTAIRFVSVVFACSSRCS